MLERIALDQNLVDWSTSRKTSNRRRPSNRASQGRINVLTARFRNALKKSVEGIMVLVQSRTRRAGNSPLQLGAKSTLCSIFLGRDHQVAVSDTFDLTCQPYLGKLSGASSQLPSTIFQ